MFYLVPGWVIILENALNYKLYVSNIIPHASSSLHLTSPMEFHFQGEHGMVWGSLELSRWKSASLSSCVCVFTLAFWMAFGMLKILDVSIKCISKTNLYLIKFSGKRPHLSVVGNLRMSKKESVCAAHACVGKCGNYRSVLISSSVAFYGSF